MLFERCRLLANILCVSRLANILCMSRFVCTSQSDGAQDSTCRNATLPKQEFRTQSLCLYVLLVACWKCCVACLIHMLLQAPLVGIESCESTSGKGARMLPYRRTLCNAQSCMNVRHTVVSGVCTSNGQTAMRNQC